MTITVEQLVQREVSYCVSALISELYSNEKYQDELQPIMTQDDWESAAREEGWINDNYKGNKHYFLSEDDTWEAENNTDGWREVCEEFDIDPQLTEAYEHWIVSDWLAGKLEARGEMVLRDFYGLTIWGRACTGQAIYCDSVIGAIYTDLTGQKPTF